MTFEYQKELLSTYQGSPVTLENFVNGEFSKYSVNNNFTYIQLEVKSTYVKPQTLVHLSNIISQGM